MLEPITIKTFRELPKSDLHNHCLLGGKRSVIEKHYGQKLAGFRAKKPGIHDLNHWIASVYRPFIELPGSFEKAVEAAFIQALADGVTRLEMSVDVFFGNIFNVSPGRVVDTLKYFHQAVAPEIDFAPELGFARSVPVDTLQHCFESFLEIGYFKSIDLYDDEFAQPVVNFKSLYRLAKKNRLKCKAHAGEFGTAASVQEAVEVLELDEVQHGIGASDSPEVMKWLSEHKIRLNVCPTSNIRLKRIRSYKTHPIRILFDHGVRVTVNTDDALVFGDGVSEQLLKLFRAGLFSYEELESIRLNGLD